MLLTSSVAHFTAHSTPLQLVIKYMQVFCDIKYDLKYKVGMYK